MRKWSSKGFRAAALAVVLQAALSIVEAAAAQSSSGTGQIFATLHLQFVDDDGVPVRGIQSNEIEVFASGTPQQLVRLWEPTTPFHVGLLLDVSPSTEENIDAIRSETSRFFRSLREDDDALILTFDSEVYVDCDWTTDRKKVDEAIWEFGLHKPGDTSVVYDAPVLALEQKYVERGPRHALILFTDGFEVGSSYVSRKESVQVLREWGILIYVIQYDSRNYHRRLFGRGAHDPRYPPTSPPPTSPLPSGTKIGGIVIGVPGGDDDARETSIQHYYERASEYLWQVAQAGRGERFSMLNGPDLARIYDAILDNLKMIYTVSILPTKKASPHLEPVTVRSTRQGVHAKLITKGYWAP